MSGDLERGNGHHSYGTSAHDPGCDCVRCTGFTDGNQLSVRHGAYSSLKVGKRAAQFAGEIRDTLPVYEECDEVTVRLLSMALARCEFAAAALDKLDEISLGKELASYRLEDATALQRLRDDLRSWIRTAAQLADSLGLSPTSRSRLGVNVATIASERARARLLERYGAK